MFTTKIHWHYIMSTTAVFAFLSFDLLTTPCFAQTKPGKPNTFNSGKMKVVRNSSYYQGPKIMFLEFSGGYSFWSNPVQSGFEQTDDPLLVSIEYGNSLSSISYGIGFIGNADFQRDSISLQNQHAFLYGKYRYAIGTGIPGTTIELCVMGGVQGWRSELNNNNPDQTEFSIPGGQKDSGLGAVAGSGIQLRYRNFGIGGQIIWLPGKATYRLADHTEVGVLTGSMQLQAMLSYRIHWGHKKVRCPIYSK